MKDWFKAYLKYRADKPEITVKVDFDWFELALAVIFVMWAYKELFL